jgi:hypothetical protein
MSNDAVCSLNEAIKILPSDENTDYFEALRNVPSLVQSESNPLLFIQFENYNVWNAAKRITTYWRIRRDIFGDAFLKPMHLTGSGALNAFDIKMLETGVLCPLPKTSTTNYPVLWWDREKLDEIQLQDLSSRARVLFYMMQVMMTDVEVVDDGYASSDTKSATKKNERGPGFVMIANFPTRFGSKRDHEWTKKVAIIGKDVFALRTVELHLVIIPTNRAVLLLSGVVSITTHILSAILPSLPLVHTGTSIKEIQIKLRQVGFEKRNLPPKLGGNWKDEKFEQFLRRHRKIEEEMFLTTEEKLSRKRQVNMIHSRQKRERRKIEHEVLQSQCDEISKRNNMLQASIDRFEHLIGLAELEIEKFETNKSNNPNCQLGLLGELVTLSGSNSPIAASAAMSTASQNNSRLYSLHQSQSVEVEQLNLLATMLQAQQSSSNQEILQLLNVPNPQLQQASLQEASDGSQQSPLLSAYQIQFLLERPQLVQQLLRLQEQQRQQQLSDLQVSQQNILSSNQIASFLGISGEASHSQYEYPSATSFQLNTSHPFVSNESDAALSILAQLQRQSDTPAHPMQGTDFMANNTSLFGQNFTIPVPNAPAQQHQRIPNLQTLHPSLVTNTIDSSSGVNTLQPANQPQNDEFNLQKSIVAALQAAWPL